MISFFKFVARLENLGVHFCRVALVIVLLWIGGLKVFRYEAVRVVPLVANSPLMSFFYKYDPPEYKKHMNREGEYKPENISWQVENNTYTLSYGLGVVIVAIGIFIALYPIWPGVSAIGSFLCFGMSLVTLSFLITTPEAWIPDWGDAQHGFPYLSGVGRLVIKDVIMMGASIVTMSGAAKKYLITKGDLIEN